jgi:ketosteroid isomerase-like protein
MTTLRTSDIILAFVEAINRHDVDRLCRMMTDDHLFIDSLGEAMRGKDAMRGAWTAYFLMVPDYSIVFEEVLEKGETAAVFGTAQGTYAVEGPLRAENAWRIPFAARGGVRDGLVAQWQVYADNEPVRRLMAGATS